MIVSHKYKFIFLKTRKTAGTSLEIALSKFCGEDDIITPITTEDEDIRKNLGYRGPQNTIVPYSRYSLYDWRQRIIHRKKMKYYNHIPACKVKQWIGDEIWDSYYKFCFERNPWDKAISLYYFHLGCNHTSLSLKDFINQTSMQLISNYHIYAIKDKIAVNHIGQYENLEAEINHIVKQLKLPEHLILPKAKGNFRKETKPYQDVIEPSEQNLIQNICAKEIYLFGYQF